MLAARDLAFGFPSRRVGEAVSFVLERGETLALLGGNGAGKTTLLRTLMGLLPPLAGRVELDGAVVSAMPPAARAARIAYVPQQHLPAYGFCVADLVVMGRASRLPLFARPGRADRELAQEALEALGIAPLARRPVTELSGGERQLVLIARALAQQADIVILDEPTASLDFGHRVRVLRELDRLRGQGFTIVFSTHEPDHALMHADRALLLHGGRPLALDTVARALTVDNIERLYQTRVQVLDAGGRRVCVPADQAGPVRR
ncbi:MAG: ABC transporter ATP-binding protein [Candidatus Levyibacteriota bacterium]